MDYDSKFCFAFKLLNNYYISSNVLILYRNPTTFDKISKCFKNFFRILLQIVVSCEVTIEFHFRLFLKIRGIVRVFSINFKFSLSCPTTITSVLFENVVWQCTQVRQCWESPSSTLCHTIFYKITLDYTPNNDCILGNDPRFFGKRIKCQEKISKKFASVGAPLWNTIG